jgi:4-phospho-D-threonate 3-dehydrogenase / 4-phospho-D-erythronate 3-dehydrogenase
MFRHSCVDRPTEKVSAEKHGEGERKIRSPFLRGIITTMSRAPRIGITMGDAAGIGPEIVLKALAASDLNGVGSEVFVIGDRDHIAKLSRQLGLTIDLSGDVVFDLGNVPPEFDIGLDAASTGRASAENIAAAVQLWREGRIDAVATAPISKKAIALGGYDFPGHTEFLAHLTGTKEFKEFRMSFFGGDLRVVLLSTHLSLRDAIELVKTDALVELIGFTDKRLSQLLGRPVNIAVAGLNPHASESGMFGREEAEEIAPAIARCQHTGISVSGPYSPDTIFLRGFRGEFDAVIALYHDQATIPVKSLSFGSAVNVTLGLPLIRTSVDHGTAYDIAGKGVADASSMLAAIKLAAELVRSSPNHREI